MNKKKLIAYAKSQFIREVKEYPNRGNIFDRNGSPLAINIHVYNIFTVPKNSEQYYQGLKKLTKLVPEINYDKIKSTVKKRKKYTWISRKIILNETQVNAIKKLDGIFVESHTERVYPNKELAAQVLGFVGLDNTGLAGIEFTQNAKLKGKPRISKYIRDAKGRPIKYETKLTDLVSEDIQLSIDKDVQGALESYLKDSVIHHEAFRGGAAVMDAETGELIAIANYPTYDPNKVSNFPSDQRKLAFVTDPFEPGSIFKPLTVASVLEHKVATPETKYFCEYGRMKVQNHWITEAETHEKFEWLTVGEILKYSSNVGTTKLGFNLQFPKLSQTMTKFKLGEKTGIEIAGESKGIFPFKNKDKIKPLSLSNISFGQGVATTAIQMLRMFATIANDGYLVRPTLIRNDESQLKDENRVISKQTAQEITKMLIGAVEEGTGKVARIPHYIIAGKTGTAQRVSPKGGYEGYISSFVAYPVNVNKKFVVMAYIDHPKTNGYYGSKTAAPIVKKITQYILYKKKGFAEFARYDEKSNKLNMDTVHNQMASSKKTYSKDLVPNFVGLDKSSAIRLAEERNLQVEVIGFGVVKKQSLNAGSPLASNQGIRLQFEEPTYVE